MKVTVLVGSPRKKNTYAMAEAFKTGADNAGHETEIIHVGRMKIAPCLGCQFCKREGNTGKCVQQDDMETVYKAWQNSDMVVFASPIYFWNFTGQMQSTITRLYAMMGKKAPGKFALLLNSADEDVYTAAAYGYENTIGLFGGKDLGIFTMRGSKPEEVLKEIENFANKLKIGVIE